MGVLSDDGTGAIVEQFDGLACSAIGEVISRYDELLADRRRWLSGSMRRGCAYHQKRYEDAEQAPAIPSNKAEKSWELGQVQVYESQLEKELKS